MKTFVQVPAALLLEALLVVGCATSDPTMAVVDNGYSPSADANPTASAVVYKAWWSVALFPDPVAAGQESNVVRVVPGADYAYALLAPGWDPSSAAPPTQLLPLRTNERLSIDRGGTLHVVISAATTLGDCSVGQPLPVDDAQFIVERIFPGDFAGVSYDPATCTAVALVDGAASGDEPVVTDAAIEPQGDAGNADDTAPAESAAKGD